MSQFDEQKERPLQLLLVVLSALALALTGILNLFGAAQAQSPLIRVAMAIVVVICVIILLVLTVPQSIRWIQQKYHGHVMRNRQDEVLMQLKELVNDGLNELFDPNLTHSLLYLIRDLSSMYIKNPEIHSQLKVISEKLNILSDWSGLLVDTLRKPGIIHKEYLFQRTIRDVIRLHRSLGDVISEISSCDLPRGIGRPRNAEAELILVNKYNRYVGRLEDTIAIATRFESNLPPIDFPKLELK